MPGPNRTNTAPLGVSVRGTGGYVTSTVADSSSSSSSSLPPPPPLHVACPPTKGSAMRQRPASGKSLSWLMHTVGVCHETSVNTSSTEAVAALSGTLHGTLSRGQQHGDALC
jgi:hypothetical protein